MEKIPVQQETHEEEQQGSSLDRPLKAGERLLAPSRRPDGTMRKPVRIRAGYTPQEEVAIYQSKGALFRKGQSQVPPGYDPVEDAPQRTKTKAAKKNQKRKEKRHQTGTASVIESEEASEWIVSDDKHDPGLPDSNRCVEAITNQMSSISVSRCDGTAEERKNDPDNGNLEKRIRALKKKIRTTESLKDSKGPLNAEQLEKISKLEIWQDELNELEAQNGLLK